MTFLTDDFLLHNDMARILYHDYAKHQPIFDYHCHLPPSADNKNFANLAEIWLAGDHYKWRGMRTLGVAEHFITGEASPREKFQAYAESVPQFLGNPLYHWTHLELKTPFGIDDILLNGNTAEDVWRRANTLLAQPDFSTRGILQRMNVHMVGTTDDPIDSLEHHVKIAEDSDFDIAILPSFRPDKLVKLELAGFNEYLAQFEACSNTTITRFADVLDALKTRLDYFETKGCVASDHGLEILRFAEVPASKVLDEILAKRRQGQNLTELEIAQYQTAVLVWLGAEYQRRGWVMQLHIGALRNNSSRQFALLGADSGYDSIGERPVAENLSRLLNTMEAKGNLPKTILYTLNPRHNEILATMAGNFQAEGIRGKVQFGSGWWFNDQKDGMIAQLTTHAQMGVLSVFVGMLTDSRSFLSYTRHEYFRRILCNLLGTWVVEGELPNDEKLLGEMVENICFTNAKRYFKE